jgi:hypothetical protein
MIIGRLQATGLVCRHRPSFSFLTDERRSLLGIKLLLHVLGMRVTTARRQPHATAALSTRSLVGTDSRSSTHDGATGAQPGATTDPAAARKLLFFLRLDMSRPAASEIPRAAQKSASLLTGG